MICIAIKMNPALKLLSLTRNALSDEAKRSLDDAWSQRGTEERLARAGTNVRHSIKVLLRPVDAHVYVHVNVGVSVLRLPYTWRPQHYDTGA